MDERVFFFGRMVALRRMGPTAIAEIARAVGISNGAAHRCCYRLYVQGVLVRIGNGNGPVRYRIREEGREAALSA